MSHGPFHKIHYNRKNMVFNDFYFYYQKFYQILIISLIVTIAAYTGQDTDHRSPIRFFRGSHQVSQLMYRKTIFLQFPVKLWLLFFSVFHDSVIIS